MTDGPRVLVQTPRFRIVEGVDGTKHTERFDGVDAMGGERWGVLKVSDADNVGRWFRDWIFEHLTKCHAQKESGREPQ